MTGDRGETWPESRSGTKRYLAEDRVSTRDRRRRLAAILARSIGRAAHEALSSHSDAEAVEDTTYAALAIAGRLRYLRRVHSGLPDSVKRRTIPRLVDAFAWGLAVFVQDRGLQGEVRSTAGADLSRALTEIKAYLEALGATLPSIDRLQQRAESRTPTATDVEIAEAATIGIDRASARAEREAAKPPEQTPGVEAVAEAVADELEHVWAAFGAPAGRNRFQYVPAAVLTQTLEPAIGELVTWASVDRVAMSRPWARLFAVESLFRAQLVLPLKNRQLAVRIDANQIAALLRQAPSDSPPTDPDVALDLIGLAVDAVHRAQRRAVANLERALKEPEPPADGGAVLAIVSMAISIAVAGVGGAIASYLVKGMARARAARYDGYDAQLAPIVKSLDSMMKLGPLRTPVPEGSILDEGTSEAVQSLVANVLSHDRIMSLLVTRDETREKPASSRQLADLSARLLRDPRNVFVIGLERGLDGEHDRVRRQLADLRPTLSTVSIEVLREVERRLTEAASRAEDAQLFVAMVEWMNFLARWQYGALDGTPRGAVLTERAHTLAGVLAIDCLVDRQHLRSGPVTLHDGRAGVDAEVWRAIGAVAGDAAIATLPVNKVYRFYLGTPAPGVDAIVVRVSAPAGASLALDDYRAEARRALAAHALDLPFTPALDGAIRHGRDAPSDEGRALARRLAAVPMRDLLRSRHELVVAAGRFPLSRVRNS